MHNLNLNESTYAQKAISLFKEGYNCSQAVFLAFEDKYNVNHDDALKLSSSFGGGMGRLREVCGAVSGMLMVAGILFGYTSPNDKLAKSQHYQRIQELANEFQSYNQSIICRELLGLNQKEESPIPESRTEAYYQKRPCVQLVGIAAAIMEQYINENS